MTFSFLVAGKKSDYVFFPEDPSDTLYFLKEGKVKIADYSDEGREIIKTILQPGEIFGEFSLFGEDKRNDFAQAMEQVKVCRINKKDFEEMMERYGPVSVRSIS